MAHSAETWRVEVQRLDGLIADLKEKLKASLHEHIISCRSIPDSFTTKERTLALNATYAPVARREELLHRMQIKREEAFLHWADTAWTELGLGSRH